MFNDRPILIPDLRGGGYYSVMSEHGKGDIQLKRTIISDL